VVERETVFDANPGGAWYAIWTSQRALAQGHLKGSPEWERIDADLRTQIEHGLTLTAADYARALSAAHRFSFQLAEAFGDADVILTLTIAAHTPSLSGPGLIDGEPAGGDWVQYTPVINMTRNPAGVVPIGLSSLGLPIGLQVIGRHRDDIGVLKAMCFLEDLLQPAFDARFGVSI
jgi:Asp-tRNA(Asn)/Glu-tRNA(Gln) amidotransferase A subunit family amidase